MGKGFNMTNMSEENGYGTPSNKPFSQGTGTYDPQPESAAPINLSGMENFQDERFSGGSPPARTEASDKQRDSIERAGDDINQ